MARKQHYNQALTSLVVDNVAVTGLGEDGVTLTYPDTSSSLTIGVTDAVSSIASNKTGTMSINVFSTSSLNDVFYSIFDAARNGQGREFPGS